ncbi:MAG: Rne/Rng family ribonuclease [Selenomonadaceae bacterium]|nr:Rne/Rng family ribonuclease [Selenomonadaceae bacterium]
MKTILVNSMPEEVRRAIVAGGELQAIEMERASHSHLVGNLYRGRVQNVLPGMQAAFVDIGREKNAFLYIGDGMPKEAQQAVRQQKIHIGQTLPVQIVKDAIGTKGPRATTHLTLPGRNVVLMPTAAYIGISRRIESEEERARLHGIAERICPKDMGLIIRTVAAGKTEEALAADVRYLRRLWESIQARMKLGSAPSLLYRDADLAIRMVRDSFTDEIDEVIVDDRALYQRIVELVEYASPELADRVKLYAERTPLFRKYHLEEELEKLGAREVELPSGGFIVIDKTEALTVIDVNTGKFVGKANLADTVYHTNLEAAAEILKQLRLRDIGGIIVVDFIDMEQPGQKEELLAYMREHVKSDPTKTNIVDITSLGLVEITRKKSRQNLESMIYSECPYCHGKGRVESPETVGIQISRDIRRMELSSHSEDGYEVEVHEFVAEELRRGKLLQPLEQEFGIRIRVMTKPGMHPENYSILQQG